MEYAVDGQNPFPAQEADCANEIPIVKLAMTHELSPVAGHMSATYRGSLLVWGGYYYSYNTMDYRKGSDLYIYPFGLAGDSGVWLKVMGTGNEPKPNSGGAALICGDDLYIFGGITVLGDSTGRRRNPQTSMLWKLNIPSAVWEIVDPDPDLKVPTPRDKTAAWSIGRKLYFFGGFGPTFQLLSPSDAYLAGDNDFVYGGPGNCWNNQLLEFDVDSRIWRLVPKKGTVPSARAGAGSQYVKDLGVVFLFGGRGSTTRLNDLYILDVHSFVWTEIDLSVRPPGRSWCAMSWIPDRKQVFMSSGFSVEEKPLDDVWILDIAQCYGTPIRQNTSVQWKCVRPATNHVDDTSPENINPSNDTTAAPSSPFQRFWHTANMIQSRSQSPFTEAVLLYGGMFQHPCSTAPCLNTLHVQTIEPPSLFVTVLRWYAKTHTKLPSPVFPTLYRKYFLLEDINRFKRDFRQSYGDCSRLASSLHGLTLKEIFDILDMRNSI
ncbi:unnamed protein product [Bursaphelenchus xylophilus]|uniref:(pine wood nematode) hypothetical protein n=1 Tax=Bursaphelenchus xylophilus TaxID=6326 RepID=A0A1I7RLC7_BURXY|nr:unnamed protein product [Bursaphelenchus xylophilus]CAG9083150.1 unnamed protein product [Bursaphelenchus xylophilus]